MQTRGVFFKPGFTGLTASNYFPDNQLTKFMYFPDRRCVRTLYAPCMSIRHWLNLRFCNLRLIWCSELIVDGVHSVFPHTFDSPITWSAISLMTVNWNCFRPLWFADSNLDLQCLLFLVLTYKAQRHVAIITGFLPPDARIVYCYRKSSVCLSVRLSVCM